MKDDTSMEEQTRQFKVTLLEFMKNNRAPVTPDIQRDGAKAVAKFEKQQAEGLLRAAMKVRTSEIVCADI